MATTRAPSMTRLPAQIAAAGLVIAAILVATWLLARGGATTQPSHFVESWFQDDNHLIYAPTPTVESTLQTLSALGVDRLRITVLWRYLAPNFGSRVRPAGFNASDPAAYPAGVWGPYDRIAELAAARHMGVDFNVTAPGPLWATAPNPPNKRSANHFEPSAQEFGQFVAAVGRRYSGTYTPPGSGTPLPRVSYWSIWNEPNQPGWLSPQWQVGGARAAMMAPVLYRAYVDAAFSALRGTGHQPSHDTILIGELAPEGAETSRENDPIPPLSFLRALYCVDSSYSPLAGQAAAAIGCPTGGSTSAFVAAHPGLFAPSGFAHHPYAFFLPPTTSIPDQNFVPLADIGRLEHALDTTLGRYGVHRKLPIYLSEYGYETNPPNPFRGVTLRLQSLYLNEAQYLAWADVRVKGLSQFLLYDAGPNRKFPPGSFRYWSTFQTGLLFANGVHKPSFNAYRLPIVVPQPVFSRGAKVFVWGMLRLAANGSSERAQIQWRPLAGAYRTLATLTTKDPGGIVSAKVVLPGTGAVRIVWFSAGGEMFRSRAAGVQQR